MESFLSTAWRRAADAATIKPPPYAPVPTYGIDLLRSLDPTLRTSAVVCTQPEPWELVKDTLSPAVLHFVTDVDHVTVRSRCEVWAADLKGGVSAVFGIGGVSALDHAKFASGVLGVPLVLCPSILSVDAGYTVAAGVREVRQAADAVKTSVVYVGDARPAALLIDFKLLQAAPAVLNRSGVGDLLSCYTALWDWNEAHVRLGEPIDSAIVRRTRELLERLLSLGSAKAVNAVTEDGLRLLSELYVLEVTLCELWGNARPELKTVTRQRFLARAAERAAPYARPTPHQYQLRTLIGSGIDHPTRCMTPYGAQTAFRSTNGHRTPPPYT